MDENEDQRGSIEALKSRVSDLEAEKERLKLSSRAAATAEGGGNGGSAGGARLPPIAGTPGSSRKANALPPLPKAQSGADSSCSFESASDADDADFLSPNKSPGGKMNGVGAAAASSDEEEEEADRSGGRRGNKRANNKIAPEQGAEEAPRPKQKAKSRTCAIL